MKNLHNKFTTFEFDYTVEPANDLASLAFVGGIGGIVLSIVLFIGLGFYLGMV